MPSKIETPRTLTATLDSHAAFTNRLKAFSKQSNKFDDDYWEFADLFKHFKNPQTANDFIVGSKTNVGTALFRDKEYIIDDVHYGFHYGNNMHLAYRIGSDAKGPLWTAHSSGQLLKNVRKLINETCEDLDTPEKALVRAFENEQEKDPKVSKDRLLEYEGRKWGCSIRYS